MIIYYTYGNIPCVYDYNICTNEDRLLELYPYMDHNVCFHSKEKVYDELDL